MRAQLCVHTCKALRRIEHEDSFAGRWSQLLLPLVLFLRAQWRRLEQQASFVLAHRAVPQPSVPHASAADRRQNASHAVGRAKKRGEIREACAAQGRAG
jgi:hypothetical protein